MKVVMELVMGKNNCNFIIMSNDSLVKGRGVIEDDELMRRKSGEYF